MDEKMVLKMKAILESAREYVESGEYGDNYTHMPAESNFDGAQIWDKRGKGVSLYQKDYDCEYSIDELVAKYGYYDAEEMFADIYQHVGVQYYFTGNQYYNCERKRIEFGFYPVGEYWEQLDRSDEELHSYILGLNDEDLREFANECDCCIEFQGKEYWDAEDVLIDITVYIGGAIVVYCELDEAFEYLENKDK